MKNKEAEMKLDFEQCLLDGDKVQRGQMIASTEVWEYLRTYVLERELDLERRARLDENQKWADIFKTLISQLEAKTEGRGGYESYSLKAARLALEGFEARLNDLQVKE